MQCVVVPVGLVGNGARPTDRQSSLLELSWPKTFGTGK